MYSRDDLEKHTICYLRDSPPRILFTSKCEVTARRQHSLFSGTLAKVVLSLHEFSVSRLTGWSAASKDNPDAGAWCPRQPFTAQLKSDML